MTETKLNTFDVSVNEKNEDTDSIPGYTCYHKFRKNSINKPSGGITLIVKNKYKDLIDIINTENNNVIWCKLKTNPAPYYQDPIILGLVYISPEGSPYSNLDSFTEIEADFFHNFIDYKNCMIMGDFNAHTGNKHDLLNVSLDQHMIENDIFAEDLHTKLEECPLPVYRKSNCKLRSNNWGSRFLSMIQLLNMVILNGRYGDSSNECTCTSGSVIDYAVSSIDFIKYISCFNIIDFNPLLSDVHKPIEIEIVNPFFVPDVSIYYNCDQNYVHFAKTLKGRSKTQPGRWENDKECEYLDNIDNNKIADIIESLNIEDDDLNE